MAFDEFLADIKAEELRVIANHWNSVRNVRRMPAWENIDPVVIARHLPIVWSWKYDRESKKFTGRLSGEKVNRAFGKSMRGVAMEDYFHPEAFKKIYPRYERIVSEPCLGLGQGAVFIQTGRYGNGERIIMPLAKDGEHADGIFGATAYQSVLETKPRAGSKFSEDFRFFTI